MMAPFLASCRPILSILVICQTLQLHLVMYHQNRVPGPRSRIHSPVPNSDNECQVLRHDRINTTNLWPVFVFVQPLQTFPSNYDFMKLVVRFPVE